MSKHTPGPWRVKDNHISEAMIVETSSGEEICLVEPFYNQELPNAQLIAEAPNMLALLKDIRDWVEGEGESFQYSEEIDQIIAKAGGL